MYERATQIVVIDGASRSSRHAEDKLVNIVSGIAPNLTIHEIKHSWFRRKTERAIADMIRRIPNDNHILWVTKSQGAARLLPYLASCDPGINLQRFYVISIDPHDWLRRDKAIECSRPYLAIENFWQNNARPRGAFVFGAVNTHIAAANHWSIVHSPLVVAAIRKATRRVFVVSLNADRYK